MEVMTFTIAPNVVEYRSERVNVEVEGNE